MYVCMYVLLDRNLLAYPPAYAAPYDGDGLPPQKCRPSLALSRLRTECEPATESIMPCNLALAACRCSSIAASTTEQRHRPRMSSINANVSYALVSCKVHANIQNAFYLTCITSIFGIFLRGIVFISCVHLTITIFKSKVNTTERSLGIKIVYFELSL